MTTLTRIINHVHGAPAYWCPVCRMPHALNLRWRWNMDTTQPSFWPAFMRISTLNRTRVLPGGRQLVAAPGSQVISSFPIDWPPRRTRATAGRVLCHSVVRGGRITFLPGTPQGWEGATLPLRAWTLYATGMYEGPPVPDLPPVPL